MNEQNKDAEQYQSLVELIDDPAALRIRDRVLAFARDIQAEGITAGQIAWALEDVLFRFALDYWQDEGDEGIAFMEGILVVFGAVVDDIFDQEEAKANALAAGRDDGDFRQ